MAEAVDEAKAETAAVVAIRKDVVREAATSAERKTLPMTLSDGEKQFCAKVRNSRCREAPNATYRGSPCAPSLHTNQMLLETNIGEIMPSWTLAHDPLTTSIEGMSPTERGNIRNLSLNNKGLTGKIPYAIENCVKLRKLFCNANDLEGPIPVRSMAG